MLDLDGWWVGLGHAVHWFSLWALRDKLTRAINSDSWMKTILQSVGI